MSFESFQPAVLFTAGMALLWAAAIALRMRRDERALGWPMLAAFAATLGAAELFGIAAVRDSNASPLRLVSFVLCAAGFLALVEFGRRELRASYQSLKKPWVYAVLVAAAAIKFALAGSGGLEAVCAYVFAPLGGFLAAVAIAQRARNRRDGGWGLPLLAAALVFFAIGFALSVATLQAFAALGLLAGTWREYRQDSPFPQHAGAFIRWRGPGAFLVLTLLGISGLVTFGNPVQAASIAAQSGASGAAVDAASSAIDNVEIDSRQLVRERASAQRNKQALALVVVVVVIAAVWLGLARWSRRI